MLNIGSCDQSNTNWQLCEVSCKLLSYLPCTKKRKSDFVFPLKKIFNHTCTLNVIIANMCLLYATPVWTKMYSVINNKENESLWNCINVHYLCLYGGMNYINIIMIRHHLHVLMGESTSWAVCTGSYLFIIIIIFFFFFWGGGDDRYKVSMLLSDSRTYDINMYVHTKAHASYTDSAWALEQSLIFISMCAAYM